MAGQRRALWKCPRCGAKLVHKNLAHSCGAFTEEAFLANAGVRERGLYERFVECVARCGPYELAPAKTRVAFLALVRFASVNRIGDGFIDVHLVLPRELESARLRKVERVGNVWVHHLRLRDAGDFDRELEAWVREAYEAYGRREWLAASKARRPSR